MVGVEWCVYEPGMSVSQIIRNQIISMYIGYLQGKAISEISNLKDEVYNKNDQVLHENMYDN